MSAPVSRFEAPTEVEAAVALLAEEEGARVLSGGTDLLVQMRLGAGAPPLFVDVKRIPRLTAVRLDSNGLRIGAAVPAAEIYENDEIRSLWPGRSNTFGSREMSWSSVSVSRLTPVAESSLT